MKSKYILFLCMFLCVQKSYCQVSSINYITVTNIQERNIPVAEKLRKLSEVRIMCEKSNRVSDSVYAQILFYIGSNIAAQNHDYNSAIFFTANAIKINISGKKGSLRDAVLNSLYLAHYYEQLNFYQPALSYYDTTILLSSKVLAGKYISYCDIHKSFIYFKQGDYQKCIEESTKGLNRLNKYTANFYFASLLNQRAQAFLLQNKLQAALNDVDSICSNKKLITPFDYASGLKIKAQICQRQKKFKTADSLFRQTIQIRLNSHDTNQIAHDYIDYGNFCLDSLHDFYRSINYYKIAVTYAQKIKNNEILSSCYVNIGEANFKQQKYFIAEKYYNAAFEFLKTDRKYSLANQLNSIGYKDLIIKLMKNKTKLLLNQYKQNYVRNYLAACLQTALVTDSVITETRHEQIGEESKLYWRDNTRDFFANAIEACYLANDASKAFYFMEKSRAVLLNDKLNELGAAAHLPSEEEAKQQHFQVNIIGQQQQLSTLKEDSKEYSVQQVKLINTRDSFEHYIKSLEQKYPLYYQYKYADNVPSLEDLQKYLTAHNQSFVHYFMDDTVAYALAVSNKSIRFIKLNAEHFNGKELLGFLKLCSDKEALNNSYSFFAASSNQLYEALFQPLKLAKGRVIICPDNFLIPFEALCDDKGGRHFLLSNFSFSYVYSARYLMNSVSNVKAAGNFLGIAPVNFASNLSLPELLLADDALQRSASHYSSSKLFTHEDASRKNFIHYISAYSVVNIFSHAKADSSNEPLLYMQDSIIHLSELQLINNPATQLIVLSACQTNVGRNATGEGIYSLARGFAVAGIPSVAATLWKADDQMIYSISEKFHEYLSKGMPKDVALQKAKLYFMQNSSSEKLLPFYWSNMVLMGNAEPLNLSASSESFWWIIAACSMLAAITFFMLRKRRKNFRKIFKN